MQDMKCDKRTMLLYAVTDRAWTEDRTLTMQVKEALEGGITCLQLREKELDNEEFLKEALEIRALCKKYKVPFIINDNVEVAVKSDADGIHVGQDDMNVKLVRKAVGNSKIIGVSVETVEEAVLAEKEGADYLGVGAIFNTSTKTDAVDVSLKTLKDISDAVSIPVVAIGGINEDNICKLRDSGIDGVAVVSAIFASKNITESARRLRGLSLEITNDMNRVLTIAGSDSSGGAGIQADIKTITAHNVYAMSVITALTAQNTCGVDGILNVTPQFVSQQLDSVFCDIYPDAVKIGMVSETEIIKIIAKKLNEFNAKNIVLDPVMVSTSGSKLISDDAIETLKTELLPLATLITPNVSEAEVLSGIKITDSNSMVNSAKKISEHYNGAILIKGGHIGTDASDLLYFNGEYVWIEGKRIANSNTHGTGCTLSSAIACNLAKGYNIYESVENSKKYLSGAIASNLNIGNGRGPLKHSYLL